MKSFPTKHQLKLEVAPISSVAYLSCDTYIHTCIHTECNSGNISLQKDYISDHRYEGTNMVAK